MRQIDQFIHSINRANAMLTRLLGRVCFFIALIWQMNVSTPYSYGSNHYTRPSSSSDPRANQTPVMHRNPTAMNHKPSCEDPLLSAENSISEISGDVVAGTLDYQDRQTNTEPEALIHRHEKQKQAIAMVLRWMHDHPGETPKISNFNSEVGEINIGYDRVVGVGNYRPGKDKYSSRIFNNPVDFWFALDEAGSNIEPKVTVSFLDADIRNVDQLPTELQERLRVRLRQESLERVLHWMKGNPDKLPEKDHFSSRVGDINIPYDRLVGVNKYRPGQTKYFSRIFDSPVDFWLALVEAGSKASPEVSVSLLEVTFQDLADVAIELQSNLRKRWQQEALERVMIWMRDNPGLKPKSQYFGSDPGQIDIPYDRLMGGNRYRIGNTQSASRLFENPIDFWMALIEALSKTNPTISVSLLDVKFQNLEDLSIEWQERLRNRWQQESIERVIRWMKDNPGEMPQKEYFSGGAGKISISQQRLMGTGDYRLGESKFAYRIFNNPIEFWITLIDTCGLSSLRISFSLLDVTFQNVEDLAIEWQDKLRHSLQQEALERVVHWMGPDQSRRPQSRDFGNGAGQINIGYSRLVGFYTYGNGAIEHSSRIFDSREAFDQALEEYLLKSNK